MREINTGPPEKQFTLPLRRFIERYLLRAPNVDSVRPNTLDMIDAQVIQAIDPNETMCHIQFEDFDGEKLEYPRLWWINSWKTHYHNEMLRREKSAHERKEANLLTENTIALMNAMAKKTGLDRECFRGFAHKIAKKKIDSMAEQFNIKIDKG